MSISLDSKYVTLGWWCGVTGILFAYLQAKYSYQFCFIEQNYMFQFSWDYVREQIALPGGLAKFISGFLIQYFMYPFAGAGVMTIILVLMSLLTWFVLKRIRPEFNGLILSLLPAICLIIMIPDFNYMPEGTVAYLLMLAATLTSFCIKRDYIRFGFNLGAVACLFWFCGAVAVLYAVVVVLFEFLTKTAVRYYSLFFIAEALILGWLSHHMSLIGEYRLAFLPDAYYHAPIKPDYHIYLSWIVLPALFIFALTGKLRRKFFIAVQIVFVAGFSWWGLRAYQSEKWQIMETLDYFARTEQWDKLIQECDGPMKNYLHIGYLNMALAEKGELADKVFFYDQHGAEGLLFTWSKVFIVSTLLSDVYFTAGNIALSQEMAFEAFVSATGDGSPRMLKRLVQTNLIYGEYAVAGKYISLLEKTAFYSDWAKQHRTFLYDDKAVMADSLLGLKRKGLVDRNFLSKTEGLRQDFTSIAEMNPRNKTSIEYIGCYYLLSKDLKSFRELLDSYYGTDVLPVLPLSFQEAVLLMTEENPDEWTRFGIAEPVMNRFGDYRKAVISNKNNPSLSKIINRDFSNTYWYYYMFN